MIYFYHGLETELSYHSRDSKYRYHQINVTTLTDISICKSLVQCGVVKRGMGDSLPITNNPRLPFFPAVVRDSDNIPQPSLVRGRSDNW